MDLQGIKSVLSEYLGDEHVIENADMSEYCSFRCGGRAALLVTAHDMDALRYALYVMRGADALFSDCGSRNGILDCGGKTEYSAAESCESRTCSFEQCNSGGCGSDGHGCFSDSDAADCGSRNCAAVGCGKAPQCGSCCGGRREGSSGCCKAGQSAKTADVMIIGNGSNILVRDGGFDGVIIKLGDAFTKIEQDGKRITAGAAALLSTVSKEAAQRGLTGMEFAGGIPGSLGGAVYMNAGAYGGEMKDAVKSVKAISPDGMREYTSDVSELALSYRHSIFTENGDIVTEVTLELENGDKAEIEKTMRELAEKRSAKQPLKFPSAGSFFKRPEGYFAGALIEEAGLKGLSVGGAQVSPLHAGFIVNTGGATASDVISLMKLVQNTVKDKSGIELVPEVRIIGRD